MWRKNSPDGLWSRASGQPIENVLKIYNLETREPVTSPVRIILESGKDAGFAKDALLVAKDGKEYLIGDSAAPILDTNDMIIGVVLVFRDQTEEQLNRNLLNVRLSLIEYASDHTLEELLVQSLNHVEGFVKSSISFYHFVEADQETLTLQQWSTRTLKEFCKAEGRGLHYSISEAGVWVDCVHTRKAVIHNDYESLQNKKGMPEGHAEVVRELVVPVIREGDVVAILGVGNKKTDYTERDVNVVEYLADVTWEIIQQKRAEEAVRKSEEKYRTLFETMTQGVVYHDKNGGIISTNQAAERILGLTHDQLVGRTSMDPRWRAIHEDGSDFSGESHPSTIASQTGETINNAVMGVFVPESNEYRWINVNAVPQFHPDEDPPYPVYTTFEDITEQKKAREVLLESEERLRTTFNAINDAVFLHPLMEEGFDYFVEVNETACERYGYTREEFLKIKAPVISKKRRRKCTCKTITQERFKRLTENDFRSNTCDKIRQRVSC